MKTISSSVFEHEIDGYIGKLPQDRESAKHDLGTSVLDKVLPRKCTGALSLKQGGHLLEKFGSFGLLDSYFLSKTPQASRMSRMMTAMTTIATSTEITVHLAFIMHILRWTR